MAVFLEDKSDLGKLIWLKLKKMKKTQSWLANETGCSVVTLSKLCDGSIKNPSFIILMNISEKLDIPPEDMFLALKHNERGRL